MDKDSKRAALAAYRLAQPPTGLYTIRFTGSDHVWAGAARDLTKIENRHRFELRIGKHRCADLQQAWHSLGEPAFCCQAIEVLDEDTPEISVDRILEERLQGLLEELGAKRL
ncbi:MAG: hypothetical protein RL339_1881 [Pseudomonadota bacterium]|jgi:hypothetical protein